MHSTQEGTKGCPNGASWTARSPLHRQDVTSGVGGEDLQIFQPPEVGKGGKVRIMALAITQAQTRQLAELAHQRQGVGLILAPPDMPRKNSQAAHCGSAAPQALQQRGQDVRVQGAYIDFLQPAGVAQVPPVTVGQ